MSADTVDTRPIEERLADLEHRIDRLAAAVASTYSDDAALKWDSNYDWLNPDHPVPHREPGLDAPTDAPTGAWIFDYGDERYGKVAF